MRTHTSAACKTETEMAADMEKELSEQRNCSCSNAQAKPILPGTGSALPLHWEKGKLHNIMK